MKNKKESGKVIEFKPRKNKKLKSNKYVDPAQKALLREREENKRKTQNRDKTIRYVAYFLLLCIALYIFKSSF